MTQELYEKLKAVNAGTKKADILALVSEVLQSESGVYEDNPGLCKMVSLDTSSSKSGFCYFEGGKRVCSGVVDCSKEKNSEIRVEDMVCKLYRILERFNPDIVCVEKNSLSRNAKTERMLGHIVGCIKGWAILNYKCFDMLSPSEWRKAVKKDVSCPPKREAAKQWSRQRVYELFGETVSDDEADAILLGVGLCMLRDK